MPGPGPDGDPAIAWRLTTGKEVDASPVIADGIVYVASNDGLLHAVEASTGVERWTAQVGDELGLASSAAIVNGIVYVGGDGVFALNAETGHEIWNFGTADSVWASPLVTDGVVYGGDTSGILFALDAATGSQLWSNDTGLPILGSPATSGDVLFGAAMSYFGYGSQGAVFAADTATGEILGAVEIVTFASPAVVESVLYIGDLFGTVHAIDLATGEERWSVETGEEIDASAAVVNGVVYLTDFAGIVHALDAETGAERWRFLTGEPEPESSPGIVGATVYVTGGAGTLFALDAATGLEQWRIAVPGNGHSSPLIASGLVFVGGSEGLSAIGSR
jgi:outer membrane protein assembly factor BamB